MPEPLDFTGKVVLVTGSSRGIGAEMIKAAENLEFEKAALLRDQIIELRRTLAVDEPDRIVPREFVRAR